MSEAEKIVSAVLSDGEPLVWSGRPHKAAATAFACLFMLVLGGLYFGGTVGSLGPPYLLPSLSLAALGLLSYFVFGPLVVAEIQLGRTFYGLTPRRAIIVFGVFSRQIRSIELASLGEVSVAEHHDHTGTISLGAPPTGLNVRPTGLRGLFWPGPAPNQRPAFERIENARTVYDKLVAHQGKQVGG